MHSLWISIFLSLCLASVSLPLNSVAHDGGETGNTSDCNSVPYPFGAPGVAREGFEVVCTSTATGKAINHKPSGNLTQGNLNPSLQLPTGEYLIQNISLQGQVSIFTGPIYQQCNYSGDETLTHGTGWLNLTGTPFTLSKNDTTFVVIGCDDVVMIEGVAGVSNGGGKNFRSGGCVAFCSNSSSRIDGSCSGLGCCQMPLPGDLKSFELNLYKVQNTGVDPLRNCSAAFFTTHNEFSFKTAYFDEYFSTSVGDYVAVLNWAIGDKSCEEAEKDVNSFACKENSRCYDSLTGAGYLCNCSQGYDGNPYAQGGCSDVDECQDPGLNPCSGHCINIEGGVRCGCPSGMIGDGRKEGSGCSKTSKKASPLNVILGICLCLVFVLAMASFYIFSRLQRRKLVKMRSEFFRQNGGWLLQQRLASQGIDSTTKIFTAEELQRATDNYSENRILGQGGYGTVYKGVLSNAQVVAIKISKLIDENQVEQFVNEITILSQINHRNVVRLLGCCLETQVPLLVYEFISNGTLSEHIHSQNCLTWEDRLRISRETVRAIAYLHSAASFPVIHRDIKSSNILLDENYTAKVSDFGASRSVPFDQTHVTTLVQGTLGYLDPEYFHTSQLTEKSDVYSFGVVLAELLTGQKPISFARPEECRNLATYFASLVDEGRLIQATEPRLLKEAKFDELHCVAHIARRCINVKGEERPTMKEVALELEGLTKPVKKKFNDENIQQKEGLIEEAGSTSTISGVSKSSRQYSLEREMLSINEHIDC
ncbi:wall-associated receptor kinase 17-like [Carex rostrata]